MLGLGVAIVVIGSGAALVSPFAGLLFYWLWLVVRPQEVWPALGGGLPLERILALTLLVSLLLRGKLRSLPEMDHGRTTIALLVFLGVNCASAVTGLDRGFAAWAVIDFAKTVIFFVCIVALIEDEAHLRTGLWTYILAVGWVAASSLWNYAAHPYYRQGIQRATGLAETGGDPNAIASTLTLAIPLLLVLMKGARGINRILLVSVLVGIVVCIILTGSRMGFIMLLLVLLLTAARSAKAKLLVPAVLALLAIGWLVVPAEYQGRYQTIASFAEHPLEEGDTSAQESAHGRIIGFEVAWQMFLDRPILGVGAGSFPLAWRRPDTPYNYQGYKGWHQPHNLPGQILSELGLLGLLSFGWYLVAIRDELRETRAHMGEIREAGERGKLFTALAGALGTQLVLLFVGGFSGHNLYRTDWYVVGALAVVVCRLAAETVPSELCFQAAQPAPAPKIPDLITADTFAEGRKLSDQA